MNATFPENLTTRIESALAQEGFSLTSPGKLTEGILSLSDHYIGADSNGTPWESKAVQAAYLAYFLPLNYMRIKHVFNEARFLGFFSGLNTFVDFGSGPGTLALVVLQEFDEIFKKGFLIEPSKKAQRLWQNIRQSSAPNISQIDEFNPTLIRDNEHTVFTFSYVLNELESPPDWFWDLENILIIEPSDRVSGRKLLELREELLKRGYCVWAPCTHQESCPLLTHSKSDWCHQRIHWTQPNWFKALEEKLPIKNKTLTFSYLLASRRPAPAHLRQFARTTGDLQKEKGKSRQMVCRSNGREFLSWLKRDGIPQEIPRGVLIKIPEDTPVKANELRVNTTIEITNF